MITLDREALLTAVHLAHEHMDEADHVARRLLTLTDEETLKLCPPHLREQTEEEAASMHCILIAYQNAAIGAIVGMIKEQTGQDMKITTAPE